jgi:ankyrin repeat protein
MNALHELEEAIASGADVNAKDGFGTTALQYAIAEKNVDSAMFLLGHDADPTVRDNDGKTALHYAVEYKLPSLVEALLRKCPRLVAVADKFGNEPLWTAAFNANGAYEIVSLLLGYGADPTHRNNADLSPLDVPKRKRDDQLLKILEEATNRV